MSGLVTFVRARLDEDEQVARRIEAAWRCIAGTGEIVASDGTNAEVCAEAHWEGVGEHIARHDPARVLREVEAKRRLLAQYEEVRGQARNPVSAESYVNARAREFQLEEALPLLALPYADHPSYRAEWAP